MTTTLSIRPTRFIAAGGKLDSNRRYLRTVAENPDFVLSLAESGTMHAHNGYLRYVGPNGTLTGDSEYRSSYFNTRPSTTSRVGFITR